MPKLNPIQREVLADLRSVERVRREPIPADWPFLADAERFPPATMGALRRKGVIRVRAGRLELGR